MGKYVKKTARRRYDERRFSVGAVHRDPPDLHKLCEVLTRLTLQEVSQSRAQRRAEDAPEPSRKPARRDLRPAGATAPRRRDRGQRSNGLTNTATVRCHPIRRTPRKKPESRA